MVYNKEKLNAVRFFLAQTEGEGREVRAKLIRMREFRTDAAKRLYDNPFITDEKAIYVLTRIAEWADITLPKDWELYATPEGVIQLAKALKHEPYALPVVATYSERKCYLQQSKNSFIDKLTGGQNND